MSGCNSKSSKRPSESKDATKSCDGTASKCPAKKIIEIEWKTNEVWCSEKAKISGKTKNYQNGESEKASVISKDDKSVIKKFDVNIAGNSFTHEWKVLDVLPKKQADNYLTAIEVDGKVKAKTTPKSLKINFIPNAAKKHYSKNRSHFDLSSNNYTIKIESNLNYVQGWGASVVKLGKHAPKSAKGLLDGKLTWAGYRWMKKAGVKDKYWNGAAWKTLPKGFSLQDSNNFCVGFYKSGAKKFTCQYGGEWPEKFTDWDINAKSKQQKIKDWSKNIKDTWSDKFDIKRENCESSEKQCCRYKVKCEVKFVKHENFSAGYMIISDGNIRANDSLWFLGDPDLETAAHEFGHHMGNPDEYSGAIIDKSLNEDGAVNGIDADSIMGQNMTKVKKRHFRTVCSHFAKMVKDEHKKNYTYKADKS